MNKLDKVIKTTQNLIDLPYNKINIENYISVLQTHNLNPCFINTPETLPIKLMSGNSPYSGIVTSNYPSNKKRNIYIIGKGILFDSGGLNLKNSQMETMTNDKAGAIIALNIANHLRGNVIAYCPITTNFIQNSKIIPGDIIKIGNKQVLINNTDAEGRLILAEAITSLNVSENDIIISIATLTGCCQYGIDKATGVFSDNNQLINKYAIASRETGELAWCLPMFDYMNEYYKKQPIKNSEEKIKAGASQGAIFIKQFVKYAKNFIHLDIATSAFFENGKSNGIPIRSLINFIKKIH